MSITSEQVWQIFLNLSVSKIVSGSRRFRKLLTI